MYASSAKLYMSFQNVDLLKNIAPSNFLLILLVARPTENFLFIAFKVFVVSCISALIFTYLGYYYISRRGIAKPQVPFLSVFIVSLISIPLGLMYNEIPVILAISMRFEEFILMTAIIFLAQIGLIIWGFELGVKKYYSGQDLLPKIKTKKLKRRHKELYPHSVFNEEIGNHKEIDEEDL